MRSILRKCEVCDKYTLKALCSCGNKSVMPQPPRYSPQDRYGEYRRKLKKIQKKEKLTQ